MNQGALPEDEPTAAVEVMAEPDPGIGPDIALVVPAAVYDSIATDDELAPREPVRMPEAEPHPALADAVRELGESLSNRLDALQVQFDRELRAEATREKVVDRLHAELQEYKQDLLLNTLRPMFIDLIQLHDDIGKIVDAQGEPAGDEVARLLGMMRGFQQGIEDILYRQGVEPFAVEGDAFDPRRQRAIATVPCDESILAKTIAARHRKGFRAGEKVIRPEVVSVYNAKK